MKKSIKHLPKRTQEELNFLNEAIVKQIPGCEMIILYGSYARGGYVLWDEKIELGVRTSYQSDLDILVVVSKSDIRITERRIRDKVVEKYHKAFGQRRHASPQVIVEYIDTLNKELEKSQYFFTDIVKEGIKMYDTGKYQLAKPHKLSFKEIKEMAEEEFGKCFPFANEFLRHAIDSYNHGTNEMGAFLLHQACERYYHTICLVFTNYRPKNHKLVELSAMTKSFSRELTAAFPKNTDFETRCYDLLCRAYIEARYNRYFVVTKEELEYMLQRTKALKEITWHICFEKLALYDKLIEQEQKDY